MTITTSQLDELEKRALRTKRVGPHGVAESSADELLQLVAIARAALAWSEVPRESRLRQTSEIEAEANLYAALRGTP